MSATILTQTELDNYLSSLNLNDPVILKTLSSIQMLSPRFYNDILYYLSIGKISIESLFNKDINNASIQTILGMISSSGDTLLASRRYYESYLKKHISWNSLYLTEVNIVMSNMRKSGKSFLPKIFFDPAGIKASHYYVLSDVRGVYLKELETFFSKDEWIFLKNLCEARNFSKVFNNLERDLRSFAFQTSDESYIFESLPSKSMIGFLMRDFHLYPWHTNFLSNINFVLEYMTLKGSSDLNKDGVEGVVYGMSLPYNSWDQIKSVDTVSDFVEAYGRISLLRNGMTEFYGNYAFTSVQIGKEQTEMDEFYYVLSTMKEQVVSFFEAFSKLSYKGS